MTLQELFDMLKPDVYVRVSNGSWMKQFSFANVDEGKDELLQTKVIFEGLLSVGSSISLDDETSELLDKSSYIIAEFSGANASLIGRFNKDIGDANNHTGMLHLLDSFSWGNVLSNTVNIYSLTLARMKSDGSLKFIGYWIIASSGSTGAVSAKPYSSGGISKLTVVL